MAVVGVMYSPSTLLEVNLLLSSWQSGFRAHNEKINGVIYDVSHPCAPIILSQYSVVLKYG